MLGSDRHADGEPTRLMPVSAILTALLLGGGIIVGSFLALREDGPGDDACGDKIELRISAAPQLADVLAGIADRYRATSPKVGGRCVAVSVTSRASRDTVAQLSTGWEAPAVAPALHHRPANVPPPSTEPPDVWVPESTAWLELARTWERAAELLPETGTTIATSPVVIAMPMPMAEAVGWPRQTLSWSQLSANAGNETYWGAQGHADWGPFRVVFADPTSSSASLAALMNVVSVENRIPIEKITPGTFTEKPARLSVLAFERHAEEVSSSTDALLIGLLRANRGTDAFTRVSAFPVSERDVVAYNRGQVTGGGKGGGAPTVPLAAFYPPDGPAVEQVPFVPLERAAADPDRSRAAEDFLQALRGELGRTQLAAAGFRAPDGTNPALAKETGLVVAPPGQTQPAADGATLAAATATFEGVHRRGVTLAVFDTSGSMAAEAPGTGKTKMQLAEDAFLSGVSLFANDSKLGLWQFSARLGGDRDYVELLPVEEVGKPVPGSHRKRFEELTRGLKPAGFTGLYDTALAAFRKMTEEYVPGRANQVVLITDGVNEDPGSITLEELLATLVREFDENRPVGIITIAYGADAQPEPLERISRATGAKSYRSPDPTSIRDVLTDALLGR